MVTINNTPQEEAAFRLTVMKMLCDHGRRRQIGSNDFIEFEEGGWVDVNEDIDILLDTLERLDDARRARNIERESARKTQERLVAAALEADRKRKWREHYAKQSAASAKEGA